ncbi:MAG: FtsX-like permease family protein, partial [Desulfamplus sp.]|nr:FtsX-like permease family protein [Desulfamplus sp.]
IARHEARGRSWEINLLKVLGAGFNDIRKIIVLEFGFLGFMAAFFATILSLAASYGIAWFFFERLWSFRWEYSLFNLIAITLICIVTALAATGRVIRQKSAALLSD